ncbi:TonB-dependent receptor plug domain-containing protein [Thermovibrio ammonificans]
MRALLFLLAFLFPFLAYAQGVYSYYMLNKELQVIAATKERMYLYQVPRYTVVITRQQIDALGARNLFDLLEKLPEFYVWRSFFGLKAVGAMGVKQSYYSEKIQVLIDGMPILDPSNGSSFSTNDNISLDNVKQVEIVYGPLTSLYGFNSVLAVINLVTYSPSDLKVNIDSSISTGGDNDFNFTRSFVKGGLSGIISFNYREDRSPHRSYTDFLGASRSYSSYRKHGTFYLKLNGKSGFFLKLYVVDRDDTFPVTISQLVSNGNSFAKRKALISQLGYKWSAGSWNYTASLGLDWFYLKRAYNLCPFNHSYCSTLFTQELLATEKRYTKEPKLDFSASRDLFGGKLLLGVSFKEAHLYKTEIAANFLPSTLTCQLSQLQTTYYHDLPSSETLLPERLRSTFSPYLQFYREFGEYSALFNVRWDRTNDAGDTVSSSLSLMKELENGVSVKLNVGRAARVPSFEEMYIRNNPILYGNPHLKIEKENSVMPSVEFNGERVSASLLYYRSWFEDFIYKRKITPLTYRWENSDSTVRLQGLSARLKYRLSDYYELYVNYGHRFSVHGLDSEYLFYPKRKLVCGLRYESKKNLFDLSTTAYSRLTSDVPGFAVWDFNFRHYFNTKFSFSLTLKNLFNKKYWFLNGVPGEERTLWLGLHYLY